ncbi:MAG: hypothetical protein WBH44_08495 [Proteocatella sp.]
MNKNQLRNMAIAMLFVSSIVLLSIRFELFVSPSNSTDNAFDAVGVEGILKSSIRPSSIIVRYGTNNVTKLVDKEGFYYQEARSVLQDSLKNITEITEIKYGEYHDLKDSKSIQLDFEPTIDQRLLYGSLFLEDGSFGDFAKIREIFIPLVNDTSIYFKTSDEKFYRLKNKTINYMPYVDNLSAIKYSKYYSLGELFDSTSEVLISDSGVSMSSYSTVSAFNDSNLSEVIRSVFSTRYDFANKISELDGTSIISYDYGRELLKIAPDGRVSYSNSDALSNPVKTSMTSSLVIAYSFIEKFNLNNDTYVVEDVRDFIKDDAKGFTFVFAPRIDGLRACLDPVISNTEISVVNGKIYSFNSIFRFFDAAQSGGSDTGEAPLSALDALNNNFNRIKARVDFADSIDLFNKISLIDLVYVYDKELNYIPAYKMIIDQQIFFFGIKNGEVF